MYSDAASKYDAAKDPFSNKKEVQKRKTMLDYLEKSKEYSESVRSNSKEAKIDKEKVRQTRSIYGQYANPNKFVNRSGQ